MERLSFFGGVPTDPDIKRLRDHFPDSQMQEGAQFPYADVEEVLGVDRKSNRFRTVTTRWRKIVEDESGFIIGADPDAEAYKGLDRSRKSGPCRLEVQINGKSGKARPCGILKDRFKTA
jgi:hypothetical protein